MSSPADAAAVGFQDLISQLVEAHNRELQVLRQDFESKLGALRTENAKLRGRPSANSAVSLDDVVLTPETECVSSSSSDDATGSMPKAPEASERQGRPTMMAGLGPDSEGPMVVCQTSKRGSLLALAESFRNSGESFALKPTWKKGLDSCRQWGSSGSDKHITDYGKTLHPSPRDAIISAGSRPEEARPSETCVIFPNSTFRLTWDLSGLVLIGYDLITIPFNQAFNPPPTFLSVGMDWITLLFWTGDMLQGFFLGYFDKGNYVSSHGRILKRYLLTWFIPDIIVIGPEWLTIASSAAGYDGESVGELGKVFKGARAVRVLRLLRLLKLQRIINLLYDMIESEHTFICVNLAKLLLSVLVLNHVIACVWFLIGRISMENGIKNWIEVGGVDNAALEYQYTTSLHWSLTQFTPASMDVSARNTFERIFSIVVLFFAMVAFSSIVGSITGSMTSLRNMKAEEMKQFWLLRRYLRQRSVSTDLANRIFKYLDFQSQKQGKLVQAGNIKVLAGLSEALHNELTHQMHSPHLVEHPFFMHLDSDMNVVMHRLCFACLKPISHSEQEIIFSPGEEAKKMLFIKSGDLVYTMIDGSELEPRPTAKEWVSEASLWTSWRHQGELLAVTTSDLIQLNPDSFLQVMSVHPRPWYYAKAYATKYLNYLNSVSRYELIDIIRDPDFYETAVKKSDYVTRCQQNNGSADDSGNSTATGEASAEEAAGADSDVASGERRPKDFASAPSPACMEPPASGKTQQAVSASSSRRTTGKQSERVVPSNEAHDEAGGTREDWKGEPPSAQPAAQAQPPHSSRSSISAARRRALSFCPCVTVISCDPWCSIEQH